jgi:hypothetical protein
MTVISLPIEIFRRANAETTAFKAQIIVHTVVSMETNPTTRKTPQFFDFDEK